MEPTETARDPLPAPPTAPATSPVVIEAAAFVREWGPLATPLLLIATNLVPLVGVACWGWNLGTVMVLYWLENGVIGVATVARMLLAILAPLAPAGEQRRRPMTRMERLTSLPMVPFFVFQYGLFWVVHGVFVMVLFAGSDAAFAPATPLRGAPSGIDVGAVATGLVGLGLYHLVAFVYWDLVRGDARRADPQTLMMAPYPRLMVLHVTIVIGAFVVGAKGPPIAALALLVVLKTALDLGTLFTPRLGGRALPIRTGASVRDVAAE